MAALTFRDNLALIVGGRQNVKIGGKALGSFDRLMANGKAVLTCESAVTLTGGFSPVLGDTILLRLAGQRSGEFSALVALRESSP